MIPPTSATARRHRLGAACLVLAPLVMLLGDLARAFGGEAMFWPWTLLIWLSLALFLGVLAAIAHLLAPHADRFGLVFATTGAIGALFGMTMQGLFRARFVLAEAGGDGLAALESGKLIASSVAPGLLFPISLLLLAIGLGRTRVLSWPLALTLAAGAVAFPLGRFIIGEIWINVVGDVLFLLPLARLAGSLRARQGVPEPALAG